MKKALCYEDVLLEPKFSSIKSRSEVDLSVDLGKVWLYPQRKDVDFKLELPIVSAPMDTVSGAPMAETLHKMGGVATLHRYRSIDEQCDIIQKLLATNPEISVGASVGSTGNYFEDAAKALSYGARFICIDVAHGHHSLVRDAIKRLKGSFQVHVMAGNVATREAYEDLSMWGADSVRCGVGGGSVCTTRIQTGHGVPGLQTILDCAKTTICPSKRAKIIADGGLRTSGDIVKALAAGADLVMLGSILAGTSDSPGEVEEIDGKLYKKFRGMASYDAQNEWRGKANNVEGISTMIPYKGNTSEVLSGIKAGVQSGLSYSGARNIKELQANATFIRQSVAGARESSAHIGGFK